jgi:ubiquinone/menaquinone biosynthesis C-methylase UbiE
MDKSDPAYPGQAGYTPWFLSTYDRWVIGFMARFVWRSSTPAAVERYRRNVGERHLDVGPGTGYFLAEAELPSDAEITLLDPNTHVLDHASNRLEGLNVTSVEADVLKPLPLDGQFDSVALHHVLHCLPGPQARKATAIRNVAAVMKPDGVLFGGTLLGLSANHSAPARAMIRIGNWHGGFDCLEDTVEGLRQILDDSFGSVEIEVEFSLAYFTARQPR